MSQGLQLCCGAAIVAMNVLAPAFANVHNFVYFIVFDNCRAYFDSTTQNPNDSTRRDEYRHLFNAVAALDCAVDHAYHSKSRPGVTDKQYLVELAAKEPAIGKVRELSNALKHCITTSDKRPNARDVARSRIHVSVVISEEHPPIVTSIKLSSEVLLGAKETIEAAFRFWMDYAKQLEVSGPA
jgi:hypothetical protein